MSNLKKSITVLALTGFLAGTAFAQTATTEPSTAGTPSTGQDTNKAPGNSGTEGSGKAKMKKQHGMAKSDASEAGTPSTGQDTNVAPGNSGTDTGGSKVKAKHGGTHKKGPGTSKSDDTTNR